MKKTLVFLFIVLMVFALASCKNEPEQNATPEPDNTPAEPEFEEPDWESGVLRVRPADGATFSQSGKFQFKMTINYNAGEPIEFKLKCTDDVTGIEVREGGNGDTFFIPKGTSIDVWEKDEDGWYIISIKGEDVVPVANPCFSLGITARLPDANRALCYVAIKDMKINNVPVDFTTYAGNEASFIVDYVTSPNQLDIYIEE